MDQPLREARRSHLRGRLRTAFERGGGTPWPEMDFNDLALEIARYQAVANPIYGSFLRRRGLEAGTLSDWREIPPLPARAFREFHLACEPTLPREAVFRTSGTTGGVGARGEHPVRELALYRESLLSGALHFLRPAAPCDGSPLPPLRILALLPPPELRPDSSLIVMAQTLMEHWGDGSGGYFAGEDWRLDLEGFHEALMRSQEDGIPVLLLATAFALVAWLEGAVSTKSSLLPPGSLLMETGGFKGRSREVPRDALYTAVGERLDLPRGRIVNEYGMTELLSQFYEPVLREEDPSGPLAERIHRSPPWLRSQVLSPWTLEPLPEGEAGLLMHLDLANLDSVCAVLTEDMGVAIDGGIRLLGRMAGAEPRGCSLMMEELLRGGAR